MKANILQLPHCSQYNNNTSVTICKNIHRLLKCHYIKYTRPTYNYIHNKTHCQSMSQSKRTSNYKHKNYFTVDKRVNCRAWPVATDMQYTAVCLIRRRGGLHYKSATYKHVVSIMLVIILLQLRNKILNSHYQSFTCGE